MGVPAFFRWLTRKYPSVIVHCIEEKPKNIDGTVIPEDTSKPNPNGVEFDNLYLDMNGIIHPCTHPEDKPAPKNEEEMMLAIFECIDRLFRIVRPRKVLYMAIDGVAPRAKMNQQRSRRFRASKEVNEKHIEIERIREELAAKGCDLPPLKPKETHFDSNCITPGTPFMDRLSKCLHFYIHDRLNNDPGWKGIKVILSDANVPGEGEHKIMDYIRRQRALPDHDPNTAHCLCGADADLIMLGLATHEPNFTIIREEFRPNKPRPCEICSQIGHDMKDCLGIEKEAPVDADGKFVVPQDFSSEVEFIFVRINVLREYLAKELQIPNLPFPFDLERAVDDWVLMCFFVGNDFLPHLPSLEIREGAIDRLVKLYKETVYKTGGYLTDSGFVTLSRVQLILSELGLVEDEIFRTRQQNETRFKERMKNEQKRKRLAANCYDAPAFTPRGQFAPVPIGSHPMAARDIRHEARNMRVQGMHTTADGAVARSNRDAASAMKAMLIQGKDLAGSENENATSLNISLSSTGSDTSLASPSTSSTSLKRKLDESDEEEDNDEVRLWEAGFKDRYYDSKFRAAPNNYEFRAEVARQYVLGICWVLQYYYQGCASWEWYFPYHYAPFASDFVNIADVNTDFPKDTKPFEPLEQLMSVFPAASRSHVPEPWGRLMYDPESPIIDFYPEDFSVDLNGKKFAWQGVALLPFVDEKRLKSTLVNYYDKLTTDEIKRNIRGDDRLYMRRGNDAYDFLVGLYESPVESDAPVDLDPSLTQGMSGKVLLSEDVTPYKGTLAAPLKELLDIEYNEVVCVRFRDPKFDSGFVFPAKRHPKAVDPPQVLKPGDLSERDSRNWRPMIGMAHSNQRAGLGNSGHRTLNHVMHGQGRGGYNHVAPPMNAYGNNGGRQYDRNDNFRNSRGGGQGGNGWNRGSNYGGSHSGHGFRAADGYSSSGGRYDNNSRNQQSYGSYNQQSNYSSGYGGGGGGSYGYGQEIWTPYGQRDMRHVWNTAMNVGLTSSSLGPFRAPEEIAKRYSSGGGSSSYSGNYRGSGGGGSGMSSGNWRDNSDRNSSSGYQSRGSRDGGSRGGGGSSQQQGYFSTDYNTKHR